MWKVKRILDKGPGEYYRFHVSGENLSREIPTDFHWSVPDLDDAAFFLADDVEESTRQAFARARDPAISKRR